VYYGEKSSNCTTNPSFTLTAHLSLRMLRLESQHFPDNCIVRVAFGFQFFLRGGGIQHDQSWAAVRLLSLFCGNCFLRHRQLLSQGSRFWSECYPWSGIRPDYSSLDLPYHESMKFRGYVRIETVVVLCVVSCAVVAAVAYVFSHR
jgi:hypothetical protein